MATSEPFVTSSTPSEYNYFGGDVNSGIVSGMPFQNCTEKNFLKVGYIGVNDPLSEEGKMENEVLFGIFNDISKPFKSLTGSELNLQQFTSEKNL